MRDNRAHGNGASLMCGECAPTRATPRSPAVLFTDLGHDYEAVRGYLYSFDYDALRRVTCTYCGVPLRA